MTTPDAFDLIFLTLGDFTPEGKKNIIIIIIILVLLLLLFIFNHYYYYYYYYYYTEIYEAPLYLDASVPK